MLYKPKSSRYWWVSFSVRGQRVRKSTGTDNREQAEELHDRLKVDLWRETKLGEARAPYWQEAVVSWSKEKAGKATLHDDLAHISFLNPFLKGKKLDQIDEKLVREIKAKRMEGCSNATVNRTLAVLRGILKTNGFDRIKWGRKAGIMLPEVSRIRWIDREEADRLVNALPHPINEMARFSLATGLRASNVFQLEWSQVDLERRVAWIHPDQAKSRKAISVPLSPDAILVLRRMTGEHDTYVFPYKGKLLKQVAKSIWKRALKKAEIDNFRWHDLRHTWASWHIQNGTPLGVLQALGGWADIKMVMRYAHLANSHLAQYADALSRPRLAGICHSDKKSGAGEGT